MIVSPSAAAEPSASPAPSGAYVWAAEVGAPVRSLQVVGSTVLAVSGGRILAFSLECGTHRARCRPSWNTAGGGFSSFAVRGRRMYAAGEAGLAAFPFPCRSASRRCRSLWVDAPTPLREHASDRNPWLGVPSLFTEPVVANGVVYVGASTLVDSHPGANLGRLYAYSGRCASRDGCPPLWTSPVVYGPITPPLVVGDRVYAPTSSGLFAFPSRCRADGGVCRPLWFGRANVVGNSSMVMAAPALADGVVYVTTRGDVGGGDARLAAIFAYPAGCRSDGGACEPLWRDRLGRNRFASEPVVAGGNIFVSTGEDPGFGYPASCGIDGVPCDVVRSFVAPGEFFRMPVVARDDLIVSSYSPGRVYGFPLACGGRASCHPAWGWSPPGRIPGEPVVSGGYVYVAASRAVFAIAIGPGGGTAGPSWSWSGPGALGQPVVAGRIVLVSAGRALFALRGPD